MPSLNLTPAMTLGIGFVPLSRRQVFDAAMTSLNTIRLGGGRRQRALGAHRSVPHGREHAFDGIGNRYEMARCQRSAAVFLHRGVWCDHRDRGTGARSADRPMHTMSRELELGLGLN